MNAPILQGFNPTADTFITTDASGSGLGSVLSQKSVQGKEVIIAFVSRSLSPMEEKYSVIEREKLACVWAMGHFRAFIWGRKFTLWSDHKPLTKLLTTEGLSRESARIARFSMRLLDYVYDFQYVPGNKNVTADFLSRMSLSLNEVEQDLWSECSVASILNSEGSCCIKKEEWMEAYLKDEIMLEVKNKIMNGWGS